MGPLAAAVLTGVTGAACSAGPEASAPAGGGRPGPAAPVPVTAAIVEQKSMPIEVRAIGTVIAASTVQVRAQITGEMTAVHFKEGEDVEQGQLLVSLDRRPFEAALHQAEAALQRDQARAANARAQAARYRVLAEKGIATREQADQIATNATALEATVTADRAAIENATVQLQYATISAPISGRTGLLQVHPGNLLRANDTTPIVAINKITPVYVSFALPEPLLPDFKRYMSQGSLRIDARAPTDAAPPSTGRINFIDNAVDTSTGTIKVKGTFPNEDHRLWPGQFVNVTVTLSADANAIVVPSAAVQTGQQGPYIFVIKPDQTVDLRAVTVARTKGDEIVVSSGVAAGETVVTDGQLRLVPGSKVTVKTGPAGTKAGS